MSKCYLVLVGRQVQVHAAGAGAGGRGQLRDQVGGHLSSGKNSSLSFSTSVVDRVSKSGNMIVLSNICCGIFNNKIGYHGIFYYKFNIYQKTFQCFRNRNFTSFID